VRWVNRERPREAPRDTERNGTSEEPRRLDDDGWNLGANPWDKKTRGLENAVDELGKFARR